jgi:replicative DNA helicase
MNEPRREVPNSIEAEQALIGAILLNNDAFDRVPFLKPDDFYEAIHGTMFDIAAKLIRAGKKASLVTIKPYLPAMLTDDVSMQQYLSMLAKEATTIINAGDFGTAIHETAVRRKLIVVAEQLERDAFEADINFRPQQIIETAERELFALAGVGGTRRQVLAAHDAVSSSLETLTASRSSRGLSGLPTGLMDLDRLMGGMNRSDLVILAARPAMGKTAMATNIAHRLASAFTDPKRVLFFSLEMSAEQLMTRILADMTGISSADMRRGNVTDAQFGQIEDASRLLSQCTLDVDDNGGQDVGRICTTARRHKRTRGLDLIIIDYLQLLAGTKRTENRVQELTEITTTLKGLAKDLNVPILALSQLSRQVENRDDKRPQLSDLRESGSIEQDADVVLFIYREEYYEARKEPKEGTAQHLDWQARMEACTGKAEIIIGKQRHGPTGIVEVAFSATTTKFSDLARAAYYPERAS